MSISKAKYNFAIDSLRQSEAKVKELEAEMKRLRCRWIEDSRIKVDKIIELESAFELEVQCYDKAAKHIIELDKLVMKHKQSAHEWWQVATERLSIIKELKEQVDYWVRAGIEPADFHEQHATKEET